VAMAENAKTSEKKKTADADAAGKADDSQSAIPPSIANANAQLAAADLPADTNSVSTKASNMLRTMAAKQGDSAEPETPDLVTSKPAAVETMREPTTTTVVFPLKPIALRTTKLQLLEVVGVRTTGSLVATRLTSGKYPLHVSPSIVGSW